MKNIYVLTGMSGVGKTSVINEILKTGSFYYPKMYTTRPTREHIIDGKIHTDEDQCHLVKTMMKRIFFPLS